MRGIDSRGTRSRRGSLPRGSFRLQTMSKPIIEQAIEILQATRDGEDLAPEHLKLVEIAVNGWLNEAGEVAFAELYANVKSDYRRPCFHGIQHLTIDHQGYVYWKGEEVEHDNPGWAYSEEAKAQAQELAQRCMMLENQGKPVNTTNAI